VIGPALAASSSARQLQLAFAINTLSFFAVIVAIAPMTLPPPAPHGHETIRKAIAGGLRFVRRDAGLRAVVTYLALNSLLAAPFIALIPAVALKVFDEEKLGTSLFVTAQGAGAVVMALLLGGLSHRVGCGASCSALHGAAVRARALAIVVHPPGSRPSRSSSSAAVPRMSVGLQHRREAATAGAAAAR
jgi:fucose permease